MKQQQSVLQVILFIGIVSLIILSLAISGDAQVPRKINYQGYLTDSVTGMPVNGDVEMSFAIYDVASGGTALWTETRTVPVTDGQYSVQLGENTPIDLLEPKPYWLGVQIGEEPELTPREELTSALYALFAKYLEGITIKDGKVGIGTDDPQEMLDVHGNAHIHGMLRIGPNCMMIGSLPMDSGQEYIYTTEEGETISFTNPDTGIPTDLADIGNLSTKGSITATGIISAGEISTERLGVNGQIKGNELCIGNDCRNSWPKSTDIQIKAGSGSRVFSNIPRADLQALNSGCSGRYAPYEGFMHCNSACFRWCNNVKGYSGGTIVEWTGELAACACF